MSLLHNVRIAMYALSLCDKHCLRHSGHCRTANIRNWQPISLCILAPMLVLYLLRDGASSARIIEMNLICNTPPKHSHCRDDAVFAERRWTLVAVDEVHCLAKRGFALEQFVDVETYVPAR